MAGRPTVTDVEGFGKELMAASPDLPGSWLIKGVAVKEVGDTGSALLVKEPARRLLSPRRPSDRRR
ncbi:hypothetical protein BBK14_23470 [Parafrankia soli]|uniref:Uncharacterized protein n=1 Tax=Parafrankia soli TaxID=2599596 RepID=A0A1S1PRJ5_9ACTN|nr:hypothetical protein [Parafrankia soli]OHV23947.1 hypothetical protein BBK14_23470 [Parafrankia soli]